MHCFLPVAFSTYYGKFKFQKGQKKDENWENNFCIDIMPYIGFSIKPMLLLRAMVERNFSVDNRHLRPWMTGEGI